MRTSQIHSARGWELSAGCSGKCCCSLVALGQVLSLSPAQNQALHEASPCLVLVLV